MARVLDMTSRQDWLHWRRGRIGASEAGVVAGVSPFMSRLELFLEKMGRLPQTEATPNMLLGLALEPVISDAVACRTGVPFEQHQVCLESDDHNFMSATIDAVDVTGEIYEFKAPGQWSAKELGDDGDTDSLPEHWILQAQHQMIVAGGSKVTVATITPSMELLLYLLDRIANGPTGGQEWLPKLDVRTYPVYRNPDMVDALVSLERDFWKHVQLDVPPDEVKASDARVLAQAFLGQTGEVRLGHGESEAAKAYLDLAKPIKDLEELRELARARLLLSMGNNTVGLLPNGQTVKRSVIEMKEGVRKAHTQVRLAIKGVLS